MKRTPLPHKEIGMKKIAILVFTMMLAASLSFAQGTTGSTDKTDKTGNGKTTTGKKATKAPAKGKKGGKKGKKSSGGTTTPAPKKPRPTAPLNCRAETTIPN